MSKNIFDRKTYNRLRTDIIHLQKDLMTDNERSSKLAHVTDFVANFIPKIASYGSDEEIIFHLNELFGINANKYINLTSKEASRVVNDLINIKYSGTLTEEQKNHYLEKISYVLKQAAPPTDWRGYESLINEAISKGDFDKASLLLLNAEKDPTVSITIPRNSIWNKRKELDAARSQSQTKQPQPQPQSQTTQPQPQPQSQTTAPGPVGRPSPGAGRGSKTILDYIKDGEVPPDSELSKIRTSVGQSTVILDDVPVHKDLLAKYLADAMRADGERAINFLTCLPLVKALGSTERIGRTIERAFDGNKNKFFEIFEKLRQFPFNDSRYATGIMKNFLKKELISHLDSLKAFKYVRKNVNPNQKYTFSAIIKMLREEYPGHNDQSLWDGLTEEFGFHDDDDAQVVEQVPQVEGKPKSPQSRGTSKVQDPIIKSLSNLTPEQVKSVMQFIKSLDDDKNS